jgi:hypothetical protein
VGAVDIHEVVMAIQFNEVNEYYSIADSATLTLPDGDWCVGIWVHVSDNTGTAYQYLVSNNNLNANDSFNLFLGEVGSGADANKWGLNAEDSDGTNPGTIWAAATGADSVWRLIVCQHDSTAGELQLWFCELGGTAGKEGSGADTNFAACNGSTWNIGRRLDGDPDRYYGGTAAEFWKGDFALTAAEITALGAGLRVQDLGHVPDVYLEMFTADATLRDCFGSNDATRNSAPTSVEHPPVMRTPRQVAFNDAPSLY